MEYTNEMAHKQCERECERRSSEQSYGNVFGDVWTFLTNEFKGFPEINKILCNLCYFNFVFPYFISRPQCAEVLCIWLEDVFDYVENALIFITAETIILELSKEKQYTKSDLAYF